MVKISKLFLISLAVFGLAVLAAPWAMAEAAAVTASPAVNAQAEELLEQSVGLADEPQALKGVKVNDPAYVPTNFGLWWRGLRERISLALTLDPVKKAAKSLKFAEERVKLADYIADNSTDPKTQEKAQQVLEKANEYVKKVEERQNDLLKSTSDKVKTLISDLTSHYANKERVLEKLEDKLPPEKLGQFQEFRGQVEANQGKIMEALISNAKLPAEVKQKIEQVKNNIQTKLENRQEIRLEQKDILEKIKAGDQAAKGELEKLRQERTANAELLRQQFKDKAQEIISQLKAGAPEAIEKLKQLNQERQAEMKVLLENIKTKAGEIKDERQENKQQNLNQLKELRQEKPLNSLNSSASEGGSVPPAEPAEPAPQLPIEQ